MSGMTAIYYSSNREKPGFEAKIVEGLLKSKGDAKVISVTQKPMDLGHNIVVPEGVGWSGYNSVRQLRLGILAAETPYVCNVESDTLYPPDYFAFRPPAHDTLYMPKPTWLVFASRRTKKYYSLKRHGFEGSIVAHRDALLAAIDAWCEGMPEWIPSDAEHDKIVYATPLPLHRHRRRCNHRIEIAKRCKRYPDTIKNKRPKEILLHLAYRSLREADRRNNIVRV